MSDDAPHKLDRYRLLGRSGLRVSPLTLGTMTFGEEWGWGSSASESRRILDRYAELGGNSIDTANFYTNGTSERCLGEFLEGRRDRFVLATKYTLSMQAGDPNAGGNHRKALLQSLEASLERLRTDYIDLLWVHAWEPRTPIDELMRALDDVVRAGKVLYIGMSNAPAWKIAQANTLADMRGWTPFVALQMQYNLVERAIEREFVPACAELNIGQMPWSPLAAGVLTGKYNRIEGQNTQLDESLRKPRQEKSVKTPALEIAAEVQRVAAELDRSAAQVSLNWLLSRPTVVSPIIGARTLAQLDDNLGALDFELSCEQRERLDQVSAISLGYPYSYLTAKSVSSYITGGADIEDR
jgi:aryl-alcohol dehydrogenase-like predicted oxidoreductase